MSSSDSTTRRPDQDSAYRGENLIFLISQPKSGSTLLQRVLAGQPDIHTSAETWLMLHPVYGLRTRGIRTDFNSNWAATGVREFLDNYADGRQTYFAGIRSFAETVYGSVLARSGKRWFLDKTPRYTMIVNELYELFPHARYLLLFRNPLAILNSELNTYVKGEWDVLSQFAPDLVDAPGRMIDARAILGNSAFELRYEDLVSDPDRLVRDICSFLDVDFVPGMLDYSNTPAPRGRMNDPVGIHKHSKPMTGSIDKWREMAKKPQYRNFALSYLDVIGDRVVADLGYDAADLRRTLEAEKPAQFSGPMYPWALAITPQVQRSLRQKVQHAYVMGAQHRGRLSGAFSAVGVVFSWLFAGIIRLAGRKPLSGRREAASTDTSTSDGEK
jgi:hypothetical protein